MPLGAQTVTALTRDLGHETGERCFAIETAVVASVTSHHLGGQTSGRL